MAVAAVLVIVLAERSSVPVLVSTFMETLCSLRVRAEAFSVTSRFFCIDSLTDCRSSLVLEIPSVVVSVTPP
jgi:hypothetical protein